MKHRITTRLTSALSLSLLYACGAPSDGDASAELARAPNDEAQLADAPGAGAHELSDAQTADQVVATADVGYGTVYFLEQRNTDGTVVVGMGEMAPSNYATTPLQHMLAQGHTTLEAFIALLPDLEPPASYVDAHAAQAARLGRDNDDIRPGVFDADAPIEKSTTHCRNIATPAQLNNFAYTYSMRLARDDVRGSTSLALSANKKAVAPAICNEHASNKNSSHKVQGRVRMKPSGGSYDNPSWTPPLAPGWWWRWHGLQLLSTSHCSSLPPGSLCVGIPINATYQLQGRSNTGSSANTYDLYLARIESATYTGVIR